MATGTAEESSSQRFKQTKRYIDAARTIGERVRQLRDDAGLTLEQASAQMDIDLKHLQKVESGQLNITLVTILRIADGLGVAPSILLEQVTAHKRKKSRAHEQ
jgi:transcriptional regulator with XRE-family HTH domain